MSSGTRSSRKPARCATKLTDSIYRERRASANYINAQLDFNQVVKQFLDTAIRHRRSMLGINTAVGRRILP